MSEPLPHYVNIAKKLKSYGIDGRDEPMMFILGANIVTAEINARAELQHLKSRLEQVISGGADLDSFDTTYLTDATDALAKYQRARRDLFSTADEQALRR